MTDTTIQLRNDLDAPLVDAEFIGMKHKAAFVIATAVLNAEAQLPAKVETDADLDRLAKHVKDARSAKAGLEAARTTEKKRFDEAGKEVQALFTPRQAKLDATSAVALGRINAHNRIVEEKRRAEAAEAARVERIEADRRAAAAAAVESQGLNDVAETIMDSALDSQAVAEKLDRVSTGSAADLVRTTTSFGTVTSATKLTFEVMDSTALRATLGALGDHFGAVEIDKAIRSYVAANKKIGATATTIKPIPGVRFYEDRSAQVR